MSMKRPVAAAFAASILLLVSAGAAHANEALFSPETLTEEAPATYKVKFKTSKGPFIVEVTRELAPLGADRFYNLVKNGFYDDQRFFRVVSGFVVQFGLSGDPKVSKAWRDERIDDDPVKGSNKRGTITFATSGKDSRTTQVFINFSDNTRLDNMGFAPFGKVIDGMEETVDKLYDGYGEQLTRLQAQISGHGNVFLEKYPKLDRIVSAKVIE